MDKEKRLKELEVYRDKLQELYRKKGNLLNEEVLKQSKKLDKIIVELMKEEKKINKNPLGSKPMDFIFTVVIYIIYKTMFNNPNKLGN